MQQPERPARGRGTAPGTARTAGSRRTARSACARTRPGSRAPSARPPGRRVHCSSDRAGAVVDLHLDDLLAVAEAAHLPAPEPLRVGGRLRAARLRAPPAHLRGALGDPLDLARAVLEERAAARSATAGAGQVGRARGRGQRQRSATSATRDGERGSVARQLDARSSTSCSRGSSGEWPRRSRSPAPAARRTPATLTSSSRIAAANRNATTLTAKKRAAWKPAWPPRGAEGPVPVPPEVVHARRPTKASVAADRWWRPSSSTHSANTHRFTT